MGGSGYPAFYLLHPVCRGWKPAPGNYMAKLGYGGFSCGHLLGDFALEFSGKWTGAWELTAWLPREELEGGASSRSLAPSATHHPSPLCFF